MGAMISGDAGARGPEPVVVSLPTTGPDQAANGSSVTPPSPPQWTERQVGGNHYRKLRIQPLEYIEANGIGFTEGNIIKLATRHQDKGGLEDIEKLIHYGEVLRQRYLDKNAEGQS